MLSSFSRTLLIALLLAACSGPKNISKTDTQTADNLKAHIQYLADDKLEGRRTGTNGEELAMSTLAVVKRETRGWKWPIIQLIYMTGLAYLMSLLVYQLFK